MKKINLFIIMCFISSLVIAQPFNNFLSLDGVDDYANHNFSGSNIPSGDFTLEFWIYSCESQGYKLIDAAGSTAGTGLEMNYSHNGGGVISTTMRATSSNPSTTFASAPMGTNAWHHFALTYNATSKTAKTYIDGQLDVTVSVPFFSTNARFWVGRQDFTAAGFLKVSLDEMRISDVIRYTSNFTPQANEFSNDANTNALYHFNGSTTNLVDASSNGYHLAAMTPGAIPVSTLPLGSSATINAANSGQSSLCLGDSTYLKVDNNSVLNDNTVWRWYSSSCGGGLIAEGDSIMVTPTVTTTYYVRGELGCAANSSCQSITITVNALPTVIANATQTTICEGDSAQLTGSGAVSYTWDNSVNNGDYVSPTINTTYTVIGTDMNNCSDTDQVSITVNPTPIVSIAAFNDDTICTSTGAVSLPVGSPLGGTYSGTGVSGGNFNPQTSGAGTFDVIYTYTNGFNCSSSDTTQITVEICTGTDVKENIKFSIAPNPFVNSLKLNSLPGGSLVQLIDISGKLIYEQVTSNTSMFIDTQKLEKGMYFLQVTSDNEINTTRVIKQ